VSLKDKNIRFVSFSSGSSGNCSLISYNGTNILIDAGIQYKKLVEDLEVYELTMDDIDAIFLTHSHTDHVRAVSTILKKHKIALYGLKDTLQYIINTNNLTDEYSDYFYVLYGSEVITFNNDFEVEPISTYHDVPSVCYQIKLGDIYVAHVTDLGCFTYKMLSKFKELNVLVIEANYDPDKLDENDRYPKFLKNRIKGGDGHLSNRDCAEFINEIYTDKLESVYLAHLSEENNTPELALSDVTDTLSNFFEEKNLKLPTIKVLDRYNITEII
jgi:phosphoribosyl 1,2-cyclic phosphodiesterase